jgi:Activator of Hsp90 ATPase homolog 1-like protein
MDLTPGLGSYVEVDERPAVRFVRIYPHPIDRVWMTTTDPGELAHWFPAPEVKIELRLGGASASAAIHTPTTWPAPSWSGSHPRALGLLGVQTSFTSTSRHSMRRPAALSYLTCWNSAMPPHAKALAGSCAWVSMQRLWPGIQVKAHTVMPWLPCGRRSTTPMSWQACPTVCKSPILNDEPRESEPHSNA